MSGDATRPVPVDPATVVLPPTATPERVRVEASWCEHCGDVVLHGVNGWMHVGSWLARCDPSKAAAARLLNTITAGGQA